MCRDFENSEGGKSLDVKIFECNASAAVEKKMAEHEAKIEELREQLVQVEKDSEVEQTKVIAQFKNEGVNNSGVASRLELFTSVVCKRLIHKG